MSANRILNPDSTILGQLDGHWQRVASLILWKTSGRKKITITAADIQELQHAFGDAGPVVFTHGHVDSLDFQLIDALAAKRLAEHDKTMRGTA